MELAPSEPEGWKLLARLDEARGRDADARASWERALANDPEDPEALLSAGQLALRTGDLTAARGWLREAVRATSDEASARARVAALWLEAKQPAEALEAARGEDPRLAYLRGLALQQLRRWSEAAAAFGEVPASSGELYASARASLAFALSRAGKPAEAVKAVKRGLSAQPRDPTLLYALGEAYDRAGQREAALAQMRAVLAVKADHAEALNFLGYALAERGERLEEAQAFVERALRVDPQNGYYLDSLGWVLFKRGDVSRALQALERAERLAGPEATILEHLGDVYRRAARPADAVARLPPRAHGPRPRRRGRPDAREAPRRRSSASCASSGRPRRGPSSRGASLARSRTMPVPSFPGAAEARHEEGFLHARDHTRPVLAALHAGRAARDGGGAAGEGIIGPLPRAHRRAGARRLRDGARRLPRTRPVRRPALAHRRLRRTIWATPTPSWRTCGPEPAGEKIFVVGHSQGGLIAAQLGAPARARGGGFRPLLAVLQAEARPAAPQDRSARGSPAWSSPGSRSRPGCAWRTSRATRTCAAGPRATRSTAETPRRAGSRSRCARSARSSPPRPPSRTRCSCSPAAGTPSPTRRPARAFLQAAGSPDKAIRSYPGFKHELFNEREASRPIGDAVAWLLSRAGGGSDRVSRLGVDPQAGRLYSRVPQRGDISATLRRNSPHGNRNREGAGAALGRSHVDRLVDRDRRRDLGR